MNENEKKKTLSGFESFIFGVTRAFALCGAAIVVVGIVILAVGFFSQRSDTSVSYKDVAQKISINKAETPTGEGKISDTKSATVVKISDNIKKYFTGDNERVLYGWLENLSESDQKDFLGNMSQIVQEAEANKTDVADAINAYKSIKFEKLKQNDIEKYTAMGVKVGYIAGIFALLLLLSILSLVLVMLTIERNTRPTSSCEVKE